MNLLTDFEKHTHKPFWVFIGFIFVGVIGLLDFLTGYEIAFSLFYLIPISLIAWSAGRNLGVLFSFVSAFVWLMADVKAGNAYSNPIISFWNTLIRLSFFIIVVFLLTALRRAVEHEKELGRVDNLTGAFNSRFFNTMLQMEIERTRRYKRPFTMAYIDLDNFKTINDQFGHSTGDQVLRTVVSYSQKCVRKSDIFARLGGDEFAILFPETAQEPASLILNRIQRGLLQEMKQGQWPVTLSIGVVTCTEATFTADEVVKMADDLMYSVKKEGKDNINYLLAHD
jgi:diguanylate cyclase (GGDEF)-like protein